MGLCVLIAFTRFRKDQRDLKKRSFFKNKPVLITIIAVVLLAVLALITSGERTVSWIESAIGTVFTPVQSFASSSSNAIIDFFQNLFNTTDADRENEQLRRRVAELEVALDNYEELERENERLRELLNFSETLRGMEYTGASVIGKSGAVWFDMLTLNAGRNQGVEKGDPVVNGDGLIGIVTDVGATWCKVTSIIDAQSSVSVLVDRTRDNGFVRGVMAGGENGDMLELYFLKAGSDLVPGDKIVTNGLDSESIPKGLTIGTISEVMRDQTGTGSETNAIITPAVDFMHIEEVMIITNGGNN